MNLQEVIARLAAIGAEVRAATKAEDVQKLADEKKDLLTRKAELEDLEQRKQTALDIASGEYKPTALIDYRGQMKPTNKLENMTAEEVRGTEEYRSAFLKGLQGRRLDEMEKRINEMASTDVAGVIPTMTQNKIFDLLKQDAPLLGEITLFQVPGNLTVSVDSTNADAALHAQNTAITPAADALTSVTLGGFEIVKVNRISATVSAMAVSAFESWLTMNLSRKLSRKMAQYCIYGTGSSQPKGIDYMNTWTNDTNAVQWAGAAPTAAEMLELISYLKGGYHQGAKFLMNSVTLYGKIAPAQDNSKFKILSDDYLRCVGYPILLDDNCAAGDIFFGNFREGMVANISAPITVARSDASGFLSNAIDFRGACLFDCDLTHTEGFVKSAADLTAGA
jgi:HK97 family phage major capsid protein